MNIFLTENPVVVVLSTNNQLAIATNIAPNTKVIYCDTVEDYLKHSEGLPFGNALPKENAT
jgi:hypothetical protein